MCNVEVYVKQIKGENRIVLHSKRQSDGNEQQVQVSQNLINILLEEMKDEGSKIDSAMIVTILLKMLNYSSDGHLALL